MSMTQDGPNQKIQVKTLHALEIGIDIDDDDDDDDDDYYYYYYYNYYYYAAA